MRGFVKRATASLVLIFVCQAHGIHEVLPDVEAGALRIRLEPVSSGLSGVAPGTGSFQFAPTRMVSDGTGRHLVATLGGVVRIIDATGNLLAQPFLDTTRDATEINPREFGMTSIALHPDFHSPSADGFGRFYTITTEAAGSAPADFSGSIVQAAPSRRHQDVLTEWRMDDPAANVFSGTRREILRIDQPEINHNLFDMVFDDDGLLYLSSGDGGNAGSTAQPTFSDSAQRLDNVYGKILRIDPLGDHGVNGQYGVPEDNPFLGVADALPELYTIGHRSPYRLTRDRLTGDLYLGEVGQVNIEEVNRIEAGGNYGWNLKEGTFVYDKAAKDNIQPDVPDGQTGQTLAEREGLIDPIFEYDHTEGRSVTGGFVYRGASLGVLFGQYVFGEFLGPSRDPSARLFYGDPATGVIQEAVIDPAGVALPERIYSFAEDDDGELYLLGGPRNGSDGVVLRIAAATLIGDFDLDGDVDAFDLGIWQTGFGITGGAAATDGDADGDGDVDAFDLGLWQTNFGFGVEPDGPSVPEPHGLVIVVFALGCAVRRHGVPTPLGCTRGSTRCVRTCEMTAPRPGVAAPSCQQRCSGHNR